LLVDEATDDRVRINTAYLRCYARPPNDMERTRALAFVDHYQQAATNQPLPGGTVEAGELRLRAWQALCRVLLAANEFIYIE
jgi:hypothetical protein